jgi:hypothetical protein
MWNTSRNSMITPIALSGALLFSSAQTTASEIFNPKLLNNFDENHIILNETNSWSSYYHNSIEENTSHADSKVDVSDIINLVKTTLGLPNKDIADIFKVTRQTLHNYKNENSHALHEQNLLRVRKLKVIFDDVANIVDKSPGALSKTYIINEQSFFDLLIADDLDEESIISFAKEIKLKMEFKSKILRENDSIALFNLTRHA